MKYRLGEICDVVSGGTPSRATAEFWDGGTIPWIKIGNIQRKYVDEADEYITQAGLEGSSAKMLSAGTILFTIFATLGEVGILTIEACTNQAIAGITIKNQSDILTDYLYYFLKSQKSCIAALGRGVAQNNINLSILRNFEVPIPDLPMQKQIVAILDKTAKVVEVRQQQLQKLDELIKARFVELFGDLESNPFDWPVCALKELVSIEPQNGLYKPQSAYVQDGSGFPIVRIDAFYNGRVTDFSALKRLECSESEVQRYLLQEDDIVINRVNSIEYLGKCAHIKGLLEETVFESNMMRLHLDDTVMNAVFATKLLCSQYMHKQIMIRAKKAVNQASINQQDVLSFRMFVPPLELQEQFAAFVEQTDKSKSVVQKALDEAQLLFDSLMQQYFG